jgi:hypothetical protein
MSDEHAIPSTAICSACGAQRGDHSGGSFHCPAKPVLVNNAHQFTESTFMR